MSRPRVLVVEDEALVALLIQDWIDELGYEVVGPAHTVDRALALIKQNKPDAAILDISLGGTDSAPVADDLRMRNVPFAFASGRDEKAILSRHATAPMLAKPYDKDSLQSVLKELLPPQRE